MNIAIILSGGVGKRFGGNIPKQYNDLCGKPVIQYVIDAACKSKKIDKYVLVIDKQYLNHVILPNDKDFHIVENGTERVNSVINAISYINEKYNECEKVIILQAVSPFVTEKIIDDYIDLLDNYDVVTTASECTGELFLKESYLPIERKDYYFCQSPEAFHFKDLKDNIDVNSKYTELIYHYKKTPRICFYTDFKKNIKLTIPADMEYAKFLIMQEYL